MKKGINNTEKEEQMGNLKMFEMDGKKCAFPWLVS